MRARSNHRHLAPEHVQKLRQLVFGGLSLSLANASNSVVIRRALLDNLPFFQNCHAAELVDLELSAIEAPSPLTKNHGTRGIDHDGDPCENEYRQQSAQECPAHYEV